MVLLMVLSDTPARFLLDVVRDRNVVDIMWQSQRSRSVVDTFGPSKAAAAEVTIDGTVNTTIAVHQKSGKHIVCVSDTDCYAFYINSDSDIEYQESTDGGVTWPGTSTQIHAGTWLSLAVWYDRWTPGDTTGNLVHMVYFSTADDLTYAVFNTSDNSFTANVVVASAGAQGALTSTNEAAITRGTDGDLYVVTVDVTAPTAPANFAHKCTGTCTTAGNWVSAGANPWDGVGDDTDEDHSVLLLPLSDTAAHDTGDIMLVSYDIADGTVEYKVYDDSAGSWSTNFTNIGSATDNTTYRNALGGTVNTSTGDLYITYVHVPGTANTSEVRAWKYDDGWSQLTDPWPDTTDGASIILDANMGADSNTNDLYVAYVRAASAAAANDVYYAVSADDGSSWSTDNLLSSGTDGDHRAVSVNATSDERLFAVWYDPTTSAVDVIEGNAIADLYIADQERYRWFNNADSTDVGSALAVDDSPATLASTGAAFRLRLLLHFSKRLGTSGDNWKLQFAARSGTCDTSFSGESYADVTGATAIAYNGANSPADGDNLTPNANDPNAGHTIVNQDYEEANNFTNTVAAIPLGQDGKWDFSLIDNSAPADTTYCFRVVKSDGSQLDAYTVVPEITTASAVTVSCSTNISSTAFGTLSTGAVTTASLNASTTVTCGDAQGCTLTVQDEGNGVSPGLATTTAPTYLIPSVSTTLAAGTEGYGIQATTTAAGSGAAFAVNTAYNVTSTVVSALFRTATTLASSTAAFTGREVLVKHLAAVSATTLAANYLDTITYSCTGN